MSGSPDTRPGIVQFASEVGKLVKEHPITSAASTLLTIAALQGVVLHTSAWMEAGSDTELKTAGWARQSLGESAEHNARRVAILKEKYSDVNAAVDIAGLISGVILIPIIRPWSRR